MSAENKASYEFLASQEEWEGKCLHTSKSNMDRMPDAFRLSGDNAGPHPWTFPAQLLSTLVAYPDLETEAKNGNIKDRIGGFPGLVDKLECCGLKSPASQWLGFSSPKPELLDGLPDGSILIKVDVKLLSPYYSRDDLGFYPTENMLKRHRVFDTPYLSASGIKGLLRWAHAMVTRNTEDDFYSRQLYGTDEMPGQDFASLYPDSSTGGNTAIQGALYSYPLFWSGNVGLEVINPQNRESGSGTNPIKYETVKPGAMGTLYFLLADLPGRCRADELLPKFLADLEYLLTFGGLSAKSSAGWGMVEIVRCNAARRGLALPRDPAELKREAEEKAKREKEAQMARAAADKAASAKSDAIKALTDASGKPLAWNDGTHTKARLMALLDKQESWVTIKKKKELPKLQEMVMAALQEAAAAPAQEAPVQEDPAPGPEVAPAIASSWLWGEKGISAFAEFSETLLAAVAGKERK